MTHNSKLLLLATLGFCLIVGCSKNSSDPKPEPTTDLPTVTAIPVTSVTENAATCGGNVTSDGGATVTARGVVWGTSQNPTIENCTGITVDGSGTGNFTSNISGLNAYAAYYVRAYATNSVGTAYGEQQLFTTPSSSLLATDLSQNGTANCYIVSQAGKYKFKATVKGGSTQPVGTPASAEILWESYGTNVTPSVGQLITNASFSNDTIAFYTFPQFNNGNAVISAKDASGNILWSWHIWLCEGFDPGTTAQKYNNDAGTMMDRNLGATSAEKGSVEALGLLYQWGRKDPFLASSAIKSGTKAISTGIWPSNVASSSTVGTLEYVERHPMQFITCNKTNYDWYYTGDSSTDDARWQTSGKAKGLYDPCPAGWRVPDGGPKGSKGVWTKAFNRDDYWTNPLNWDGQNRGMDFGTTDTTLIVKGSGQCWYPAAGYLDCVDASLDDAGYDGGYWSCTPSGYYAYFLYILSEGIVSPSSTYYAYRSYAQSVRCVKEQQ